MKKLGGLGIAIGTQWVGTSARADMGSAVETSLGMIFLDLLRHHPVGMTIAVLVVLAIAVGTVFWIIHRVKREARRLADEGRAQLEGARRRFDEGVSYANRLRRGHSTEGTAARPPNDVPGAPRAGDDAGRRAG